MGVLLPQYCDCRHLRNAFTCGRGDLLRIDLLSGGKYICETSYGSNLFAIIDSRIESNDRITRISILSNINNLFNIAVFLFLLTVVGYAMS